MALFHGGFLCFIFSYCVLNDLLFYYPRGRFQNPRRVLNLVFLRLLAFSSYNRFFKLPAYGLGALTFSIQNLMVFLHQGDMLATKIIEIWLGHDLIIFLPLSLLNVIGFLTYFVFFLWPCIWVIFDNFSKEIWLFCIMTSVRGHTYMTSSVRGHTYMTPTSEQIDMRSLIGYIVYIDCKTLYYIINRLKHSSCVINV